jgi:hypothetical protein
MRHDSLQSGQVFGRLTIIKYDHTSRRGNGKAGERVLLCRCECEQEVLVRTSNLKSGNTTSCGCFHSEMSILSNKRRVKT